MKDEKEYIWNKRLVYVRETIMVLGRGWVCNLAICGDRDTQTLFHSETDNNEAFENPIEAEDAALQRAVKWVDGMQNEIYKQQN